uniref:Exportin-5 C-terminal domain-containing protein n=1 Tax=Branchiostoma floridae TaxID=7739 RepID=C3Y0J4_BRAFL|eukprot:XP_002610257.1 hypothetical protein BRAFLDRAFT_92978 [Branchiostoma floridae]
MDSGAGEEVTQEVVDDQLTRLLTREYIDLLEPSENAPTFHQQEISALGKCLLQHESVATAVLICLYSALWWNDTTSCHRAGSFAWMMLKQVLERGVQPEMINHLFLCILRGLHQHGQHESCQATLVGLGFQKHVGQQFKKDVNIPNLPPLFKPPKPSKPSLDQSDTNDLGIASLFDPNKEV